MDIITFEMSATILPKVLFKRQIALPQDHGSWVFLLSPLLIGIFAGGEWRAGMPLLILSALMAFLIRQPVASVVKVYSGRRHRRELPSALFWSVVYACIGLAGLIGLAWQGLGFLFWLAIPGLPVFGWHLWLVSRRAERRQVGVELVGSGVLALTATAAFWVGRGTPDPTGWWLWLLCWFQSAASIVYAYLRLEQRELHEMPSQVERFRMGSRALAYTNFNVVFSLLLALNFGFPLLLPLPYALQWLETLYGTFSPAIGFKPARIGVRQLIVSSLFTILFILVW